MIIHIRSAGRLNAAPELNVMYVCEQQSITELSKLLYIAPQLEQNESSLNEFLFKENFY